MVELKDPRIENVETESTVGGYVIFQALENFNLEKITVKLEVRIETNLPNTKNGSSLLEGAEFKDFKQIKDDNAAESDSQCEIKESRNVQMKEGDYGRFRFDFPRNLNLPGSFEHDYGFIRYMITVIIEAGGHEPVEIHGNLKVTPILDFMTNPDNQERKIKLSAIKLQVDENINNSNDSRMKVTARAKTNGYLPGENIKFQVRACHLGKFEIRKIEMILIQVVIIKIAAIQRTFDTTVVRSTKFPMLLKHQAYYEHLLEIPSDHHVADVVGLARSCSGMIKVEYFVQMRVFTTSTLKPRLDSEPFKVHLATKKPNFNDIEFEIHSGNDSDDGFGPETPLSDHLAAVAAGPKRVVVDRSDLSPDSKKQKNKETNKETKEREEKIQHKREKKEREEQEKVAKRELKGKRKWTLSI